MGSTQGSPGRNDRRGDFSAAVATPGADMGHSVVLMGISRRDCGSGRKTWGPRAAALLLTLTAILGGCGRGGAPGATSAGVEPDKPELPNEDAGGLRGAVLDWRPCVAPRLTTEASCVDLEVAEGPNGGTVSLFVMKIASDGDVRSPDPVVLLAGGPGQAASLAYPAFAEQLRAALPSRDIVIVDQRGTGRSSALGCELDDDFGVQMKVEFEMDVLEECAKSWPHDPKQFTTEAAAHDLEKVRRALGYPQLNLLGGSYGTRLALVYARLYEANVRTMVLDGVAPPQLALPNNFAEDGQAALDRLFRDCEASSGCAKNFPNLRVSFDAALRRSGDNEPPIAYAHPRTGEILEVQLTTRLFAMGVRGILYSAEFSALLPMVIARAAEGDFVPYLNLLVVLGDSAERVMDVGLMLSVLCAEDLPRINAEEYEERWAGTFLGSMMYELFASGCERWPVDPLPPSATQAVRVSTPTLLLSGALDPVTPARWADEAAKTLNVATHIIVEGSGHGTLMKACVMKIATNFIDTVEVSEESRECLSLLRRPPFFIDAKGPVH